jgi:hypothetical protein
LGKYLGYKEWQKPVVAFGMDIALDPLHQRFQPQDLHMDDLRCIANHLVASGYRRAAEPQPLGVVPSVVLTSQLIFALGYYIFSGIGLDIIVQLVTYLITIAYFVKNLLVVVVCGLLGTLGNIITNTNHPLALIHIVRGAFTILEETLALLGVNEIVAISVLGGGLFVFCPFFVRRMAHILPRLNFVPVEEDMLPALVTWGSWFFEV